MRRPANSHGLVGHWKLDDGTGIVAINAADPFMRGYLHLARWTKDGKFGGGIEFKSGAYLRVKVPSSLTEQTVSLWFKTTSEATTLYTILALFRQPTALSVRSVRCHSESYHRAT